MKCAAVVLAGGRMAAEDPLYSLGVDGYRSLIPVKGRPMAQWVIDALDGSALVTELYVLGLPESYGLRAAKPLHFLPDQGGLFENIRLGVEQAAQANPGISKVLLASADAPALRTEMVDWLGDRMAEDPKAMIYYNVIPKQVMDAEFPGAGRSFVRFKDVAVCGGDLNAVDPRLFDGARPIWRELTQARKRPMRQALLMGWDTLLLVALRLVTLDGAVTRLSRKLGLHAVIHRTPYAAMGMDADKPHQLAILREKLEGDGS